MTQPTRPNYDEMFRNPKKALKLTIVCKKKLELHLSAKATNENLAKIKANSFPVPKKLRLKSPKTGTSAALSVSTVASDSEPKMFSFKARRFEDPELELLSKIAEGDKKLDQVVRMFLDLEEVMLADHILDRNRLLKFRRVSRGMLGAVVQNFSSFRKQQARNLGLSILLITAKKVGVEESEFSFQASKILEKNKKVKIKSIRRSKCFGLIKEMTMRG